MSVLPAPRAVTVLPLLATLVCVLLWSAASAAARVDPGPATRPVPGGAALGTVLAVPQRRPAPLGGTWPLHPQPEVVATFERPQSLWGRGHRGADLAGHAGQPVRAALAGTVSYVGRIAGRGVVVVDHGTTRTTYEPVMGTVRRGDRVAEGDVIGRLAAVGSHCAPRTCLHWGWRRSEAYLDPLRLVEGPRPVRLLPW